MIIRRFKTILTVFSPVPLAEPTACCVAVSGEGLVRSSRLLTSSVILAGGQQRALAVWYQTGFSFFFLFWWHSISISVTLLMLQSAGTLPEVCDRLCLEWVSILHGQNF